MTARESPTRSLRVAIVGGGPAGLGAGIALSALPNVEVSIFEQARELREIGAGVSIGYNCWKVLELLGAADGVRGHPRITIDHRNGVTGDLAAATILSLPPRYYTRRVRRTRLQSALIAKVPPGVIHLNKRLASLENLEQGGIRLAFEDGTKTTADLVVGADGIRSVVRDNIFPDHKTTFTGTTIWRTLISLNSLAHLPELNSGTTWWHGPTGFVMTTPVDDPEDVGEGQERYRKFEVSTRNLVDPETVPEERYRWGIDATNKRVLSHFTEYGPRVQEILSLVPEGAWREYSAFAGPRLEKLTAWNKVVLTGDASHPLSGAFGSGSAFALQDGWILARAIEYTRSNRNPNPETLAKALEIFNGIRSPYYLKMYEYIDSQNLKAQGARKNASAAGISEWEATLRVTVASMIGEGLSWIYLSDIKDVWEKYVKEQAGASRASQPFISANL